MPETLSPTTLAVSRWLAWDRFVESTPRSGFMQSSWWSNFRATTGWQHFAIVVRNGESVIGGAVVMKFSYAPDECFYYVPEGPVVSNDERTAGDVFEAILEAIEARRREEAQIVSHLRIEPRWQRLPSFLRGFRAVPPFSDNYMEPRTTLCIDLRPSESQILARMKPKGRYNIGVARRRGVSIVEDTTDKGLADFVSIYQATASRKGLAAKPASYFETLFFTISTLRRGSAFFAERDGERIAAALVVYFGPRATYFFGGSLDTHRSDMAPYLLHFEILRKAKALGHDAYDLWGIAPEDEPDHPWTQISRFKRKFGGQDVHLAPTMDLVYDSEAYRRCIAELVDNA